MSAFSRRCKSYLTIIQVPNGKCLNLSDAVQKKITSVYKQANLKIPLQIGIYLACGVARINIILRTNQLLTGIFDVPKEKADSSLADIFTSRVPTPFHFCFLCLDNGDTSCCDPKGWFYSGSIANTSKRGIRRASDRSRWFTRSNTASACFSNWT